MFYRSDGGKYGFPGTLTTGFFGPSEAPREYDTSEEPIPDLEVERCLVTLPSYLFGYLVRKAEGFGLTESEYLTHFLIQHITEWELIPPAPVPSSDPSRLYRTPGDISEDEPDLTETIDGLVEHFTNRKPTPEMPVFVMYLVEDQG